MKNIQNYALYGEDEALFLDYLHIESIRSRSELHGWRFKPHRHHNLYQIFFLQESKGYAVIEGKKYSLTNNMLINVPPSSIHGFKFSQNTKGWVLTIPDLYMEHTLKDEQKFLEYLSSSFIEKCEDKSLLNELGFIFNSITKEHTKLNNAISLTLRSLTALLISKIVFLSPHIKVKLETPISNKLSLLHTFQKILNDNFKKRMSIAQFASKLNITPTHLNRICRSQLNVSALELVNERVLLEAKRLLIYTSLSIAEISYELGFNDPAHFSKFFTLKCQQTASKFRKKYLSR